MKRTLLMVMAVALLLTQCRKPVVEYPTAGPANENMVSMTVTVGHGGKTDINGTTGAITWSAGDKLYVGDGTKYIGCLELQSGANTPTGTFSGSVSATAGSYTFGLYYLGSKDYTSQLIAGNSTSVDIPFGTQTGLIEDLDDCHIGYGTAKGRVDGTNVILDSTAPVTMTSKVAIAYFEFKENGTSDYTGAITLSGDHIYSSMTVGFGGTFSPGTNGDISLAGGYAQRYVMLVPPENVAEETLNFGDVYGGTTKFYNGIEANKFYCVGAGGPIAVSVTPWVDLGLSVRWARCNLGAISPWDYGDYYAWGATTTWYQAGYAQEDPQSHWKDGYSAGYVWANCPGNGGSGPYDATAFSEWRTSNLTAGNILKPEVDAAHVVCGGDWRMPTEAEFTELINNTDRTWYASGNSEFGGVAGYKCVSKVEGYTGKYIFLPAAGYYSGTYFKDAGSKGYYWSSSLNTSSPDNGRYLLFGSDSFFNNNSFRYRGFTVRPVCPPQN